MDTLTLSEATTAQLIGRGLLDETNPQLVRHYEERAKLLFGIDASTFYTKPFNMAEGSEEAYLDRVIDSLFADAKAAS